MPGALLRAWAFTSSLQVSTCAGKCVRHTEERGRVGHLIWVIGVFVHACTDPHRSVPIRTDPSTDPWKKPTDPPIRRNKKVVIIILYLFYGSVGLDPFFPTDRWTVRCGSVRIGGKSVEKHVENTLFMMTSSDAVLAIHFRAAAHCISSPERLSAHMCCASIADALRKVCLAAPDCPLQCTLQPYVA